MKLPGPAPISPAIALTNTRHLIKDWRVGQIISAVVVAKNSKDIFTLRIEGVGVEARTALTLIPNQRLLLEVTETGDQSRLRILPSTLPDHTLAQALRTLLPQQAPLGPFLKILSGLLTPSAKPDLSPPALQLVEQLLNTLPFASALGQPELLKHALRDSGLFLENKLAHALSAKENPGTEADFKAGLLRLVAALQKSAKEDSGAAQLATQGEAALARVQLNQLSSLPSDSQPLAWTLELPLRNGNDINVLRLHIEQESPSRGAEAQHARWCVWLDFDLESLGPLHVRLALNGGRISADFWMERNDAMQLVERHLGRLREGLQGEGLEVTSLTCRQGRPAHPGMSPLRHRLVDLNA